MISASSSGTSSRDLRGRRRPAPAARTDARGRRTRRCALLGEGDYELETIERWGGTRSPLDTPLWDAIAAWLATTEPGATLAPLCCAAGFTDSHWLREAFGTVAYGFFPMNVMDPGARRPADPLRRRADARRRPRARGRLPPQRGPLPPRPMLEPQSPEGAFGRIEAYLRERGFFAPGGEELEADLYLGYGLSEPLRRTAAPAPREPCPLPLAAVSVRDTTGPGPDMSARGRVPGTAPGPRPIGQWERSWTDGEYAAAVEAVRAAIGRGDVYQVNLVQHLAAPFGGDPAAVVTALPASSPHPGRAAWTIVSASPELFLARRGRRVWTCADQGHAAAR